MFNMLAATVASSTSPHMWLVDGDSLMCYIVSMSRLIAYPIKVALVLELELKLGFNLVNHIKPRGNPNTNTNMNLIPIQNPNTIGIGMPYGIRYGFD